MAYTQFTDQNLRIVIIFFSLLRLGAGKLEIRRIDSPVDTLLGHNTTLPCHFSGYEASYLDLSKVSVRWTLRTSEEEKLVYWFDGERHIQNRPGSHIPDNELLGGDGSLHISNVQFSDEGEYTCTVIVTPNKATSKVTLQVSFQPACHVSNSRVEINPESERSVTCYVNDFYPGDVTIRWQKYSKSSFKKSKLDINTCTSIPVQNQDGTYNVTSVLSVKPMSTDEDGDVYSCIITHRSLIDGLTCNVILSVQSPGNTSQIIWIVCVIFGILLSVVLLVFLRMYFLKVPPEVFDFVGPELIHMKRSNLACPIVNFRPKNIEMTLYLNRDNEDIEQHRWNSTRTESDQHIPLLHHSLVFKPSIPLANNGVFTCICSISITPDLFQHNGAKLILEVRHKALKDPVRKEMTLKVKAAPVLDPIKANQESYNVGDHLELTCKIHSFHPRYINVIWYKEEESLPSSNINALEDGNGFFYITSRVRHTVTEEDYGKIFRCKVEHPGTTDTDEGVTWKL